MEISGIDRIHTAKPTAAQKGVQGTPVSDTVAISSEAKKKEEWVEMLKQMPDIRSEKIEAPRETPSLSALAEKILSSPL